MTLRKTITTGPFLSFFFNRNTEMQLKGHGHTCNVTLVWETLDTRGFPAFEATYADIDNRVRELLEKPFRNHTNENVADYLFEGFDEWSTPEIDEWGGEWRLHAMTLGVIGVHDDIGHAAGETFYRVERTN